MNLLNWIITNFTAEMLNCQVAICYVEKFSLPCLWQFCRGSASEWSAEVHLIFDCLLAYAFVSHELAWWRMILRPSNDGQVSWVRELDYSICNKGISAEAEEETTQSANGQVCWIRVYGWSACKMCCSAKSESKTSQFASWGGLVSQRARLVMVQSGQLGWVKGLG